ncbi:hypothetical protein AVDCRST_MAG94-4707 [uncultured Leptolyngbya sp.]|uniref:Uncharacterized protein n=1 Tax=uncultured Leptolyngbya sp. TaxID=332963 RepID=A0A6J4N968_9CYAN|nr:hypothetical protein AVDCRST_MAG94-4707 [uncultured Leptolyngbya sp.]
MRQPHQLVLKPRVPSNARSGHSLKPTGTVTLGFKATGTPERTKVAALRLSGEEIEQLLP